MYEDGSSVSSPSLIVTGRQVLGVALKLDITGSYSVGDDLHTLLALIGRIAVVTCLIFVVIKNDDFTEGVFDFITLLAGLVSPLLEFGERHVLDLLPSLHPGASLKHLVIVCISVTDVCNNSKLNPAGQRELFGVTYSICTLQIVSIHAIYPNGRVSTSSNAWLTMDDRSASGIFGNISRTAPLM